jgi:hypothetical protein
MVHIALVFSSSMPSSICWSPMGPRVAMVRTWVWPLEKSPEPWVLGRRPTSAERGRISSRVLPSGRL